jgi:AbrB family looped-hinge helix DNA binding protein
MVTVKMSEKGQITVPASIRRKIGFTPERRVSIETRDNEVILRPVRTISEVAGIFTEAARGKRASWESIRRQTEQAVAEQVAHE